MRVFLIIDETYFYQPNYISDLIKNADCDFIGAALITKVPEKNNIEKYMIKNWRYLKVFELIKLGLKKYIFMFRDKFYRKDENSIFYSVASAFKYHNIDYFEVEYDINTDLYLNKIKEKKPDVIISSNSLIFGKELLNIPRYCINRHSALLPSYGGLWPVFQAIRRKEKKVGVTVHTMENRIDKGIILYQEEIPISADDTIDLIYQKCFSISATVTIKALNQLKNNSSILAFKSEIIPSYYSFPTKEHWNEFRKTGRKFI